MAKIKSKVTKAQVEKGASRDFEEPQPGRYAARVHTCEVEGKKANKKIKQLHVAYQILDHDKYEGSVVHERVPLPEDVGGDMHEKSEWKYSQFLQAMQLVDPSSKKKTHSVEFDTDDLVDMPVILRIKAGSYGDEYRAEVGTVLPRLDDDEVEEEDDDDALDEEDLAEDDDEEGDWDDDDDAEGEEEEELTADDINAMGADELKALMAEYELKKPKAVKGVKGVREWLIEELELDAEPDEDDDDPF